MAEVAADCLLQATARTVGQAIRTPAEWVAGRPAGQEAPVHSLELRSLEAPGVITAAEAVADSQSREPAAAVVRADSAVAAAALAAG
jgi:hypothetical protein